MSAEEEAGLADLAADLPALADAFVLPPISAYRHLADGWMNRNWQIIAGQRRYVLKRLLDVPVGTARSIFAALSFLEARHVPVCLPVRSADGDAVVDLEGRCYCLVPWVEGVRRVGTALSLPGVENFGQLVGKIHSCLADLPAECGLPPVPETLELEVIDAAEAARLIAGIGRIVAGIGAPTPYDVMVRALLERRLELLDEHGQRRPATTVPVGPFGRVHGDLNPRNLLFRGERVTAVLDWDRMRVGPYAGEVVRAGLALFGSESGILDLGRISAFTTAYRAVMPVDKAALADAVSRLWWKRLTDVWPVELRYMRGDPSERFAGLFPPAERALEWWTSHLDEVTGAFTG